MVHFSTITSAALCFFLTTQHVSSFSYSKIQRPTRAGMPSSSLSVSNFSPESGAPEDESKRRRAEFIDLEPVEESAARRARLERDTINKEQFAKYGNELWGLRDIMHDLSSKLVEAINVGSQKDEYRIREKLRDAESRDPELMYKLQVAEGILAQRENRMDEAEEHSRKALAARSCLPHYNLEGLWVGK